MSKIALVTGATSGIGKAVAIKLAENGYNLIITGRRQDRLDELSKEIHDTYFTGVLPLCFDVRDRKQVENQFGSLKDGWCKIDVLVNNAGLAAGMSAIQDGSFEDWDQMIDTNVKGLLYVSKQVMPSMVARKRGHIVNIGSIAAKETYANGNVYCASKHAVDAITKGMRIDMLEHGIKVTAIHPGMVDTEFSTVRFKGDKTAADKTYHGLTPLYANDIAEAIWFALSRPAHVNINDMLIMPTAQANSSHTVRNND